MSSLSGGTGSGGRRGRGRSSSRSESSMRSGTPSSVGGDGLSEITSGMSTVSLSLSRTTPLSHRSRSIETSTSTQLEEVTELLKRPSTGTVGRWIPLTANYYEMDIARQFVIHRYEIAITRPGKSTKLSRDICREVFWRAAREYRDLFGKYANLVYDDANCLWTADKLLFRGGTEHIALTKETRAGRRVEYVIDIKYTTSAVVDVRALNDNDRSISAQFLDSLITQSIRCPLRAISSFFYPFGRSVYLIPNPERRMGWSVPVGSGIEAWTGLHGAVKIDQNGAPLFNADVSTSVFYKVRMHVIDFYLEVLNEFRGRSLMRREDLEGCRGLAMDASQRNSLKKALNGIKLCVLYGDEEGRKREYKFVDVCGPATATTFVYKDRNDPNAQGIEVTIEEYFARVKGIKLRFPNLPVLHVGSKQRMILIPMELLMISDKAQKVVGELSEFQKAKIIRGCSMTPIERRERIEYMINGQDLDNDDFLVNYGVSLSKNMIRIGGRVIDPPRLELYTKPDSEPFYLDVKDGKWPLCNQLTASPGNMLFAAVIVDRCLKENDFYNGYRNLVIACQLFGMKFITQEPLTADWDTRDDLRPLVIGLREQAARRSLHANLVLFFIMQSKHPLTYARIKTVCDVEEGVGCQVILAKTFRNMINGNPETNSTAHNIVLKINVRMGGINNKIHRSYEIWPKFANMADPTIFVGIDVTHPGPGRSGNSIAAVVASVDVDASRYGVSIKVQRPDAERVVYVVDALKERLISFYKSSGRSPNHIIIYRDGISETEFLNTAREELTSVMAACKKLDADYSPTISYVVVQKRHHTRFFVESPTDARGSGNIPPGTVVDERVVSPSLFDFFLSSHLGAVGTSRPSHYYVLHDTWNLTANEWQQLTFALCHLYGRCNRSVSIPAPVYYAHLACARASVHDSYLFGYRSSSSRHSSREGASSKMEPQHMHQQAITVNRDAPAMYFI
uniref:ALG-5 n=1 Tax=Ascaris suum TaxID=6253 RepID=F1KT85_ASCSU|nr:ALG-5 [Ascaris suum]